jgi:hypothetical protein
MPIIRALTPQLVQRISVPGPILKPRDRLLIVVSKFPLSFSCHVAEPFSAHTGHVTDVTNRSSFAITVPWLDALAPPSRTGSPAYFFYLVSGTGCDRARCPIFGRYRGNADQAQIS